MQTSLTQEQQKLSVAVSGSIDTTTAPELEKVIFDHLEGITELTLDLLHTEYVSSAGLRVFLKTQKAMNKQGKMKLVHVNNEVLDVLEITGFSDILTIE
ncbi:MAG: STAS domain-containing protein [Clostridia bacterium]|nr:STAS domain-containing protein [Clostridia bacterium]MBR3552139.1 STAS domain-containing protein [Clostridia bacterium]